MLSAALWTLTATAAAGLGLTCFYLQERPVPRRWRWTGWAHGIAGGAGTALVLAVVWRAVDRGGFGRIAAGLCVVAFAAGLAMWLLRRRPPGLLIALHATIGVAGLVILAAFASGPG